MKNNILIECIAKENYINFMNKINQSNYIINKRNIIIFGAGILGLQFSYVLENHNITDFDFSDNDSDKWRKEIISIGKHCIIEPSKVLDSHKYFIFLAMENYHECKKMIEDAGFIEEEDFINLTNNSEKDFVSNFKNASGEDILFLGDCTATTIAINDNNKVSISEMLKTDKSVNVLSLNGLYIRYYYNILLMYKNNLKKLGLLLNLDIFSDKYNELPKNQHEQVFKDLRKVADNNHQEILDFAQTISYRCKRNNLINFASPKRDFGVVSFEEIEHARKIHMKLNYLFEISKNKQNENINYLRKIAELCLTKNIEFFIVFLPVNHMLGHQYFGDNFHEIYLNNKEFIIDCVNKYGGKILDLSYLLPQEDFIVLRSSNEGIRENGRLKVVQEIKNKITCDN